MSNKMIKNGASASEDQFISELLDDETNAEALDRLLCDEKHCETWYRYNQVSAILRQEDSAFCSYQFTQSISAKIADEPAIIAKPKAASGFFSNNVVSLFKRTGGGLAIAASVAYAMIFSVELINTSQEPGFSPVLETATIEDSGLQIQETFVSTADAEEQARLDQIQNVLQQMRRSDRNVYEQQVAGEFIFSTVVRADQFELKEKEEDSLNKPESSELDDLEQK